MAGISSKAAGKSENKKSKYNGYELNENFNINLYESFYRMYDPQLGRFLQIDPKLIYDESPFVAMGNNPIKYNDLLGDTYILEGADEDKKKYISYLNSVTGNKYEINKNGELVRVNKNLNDKTTKNISATLSKLVDEAIISKESIAMNLKNDDNSDKRIKVDIAATGEVDMKDLAKINEISENSDNALLAGVIGHFIKELMLLPGKGDVKAHEEAEVTDGAIVSEMLNIPNSPRVQGEWIRNNTDKNGIPFSYSVLNYGNGAVNYYIPYTITISKENGKVNKSPSGEILGRILKVETSRN